MDLQTSFLGYRPTVAELIMGLILASLAVPIWKGISRAWDYIFDQIAARSNTLRAKRIFKLEQKIKYLQIFVIGVLDFDMKHSLQQLKDEVHLPGTNPSVDNLEAVPALFYVAIFTFIFIVGWLSITTLRKIGELIDPAKTIKRLEARIFALRAKGAAQRTA
jgi:hypothetical protein